jgi:hypothetical protein
MRREYRIRVVRCRQALHMAMLRRHSRKGMGMASEQLESVQGNLPVTQARWVRAKAEPHGCSVSEILRKCVFTTIQVEALAGAAPGNILYAPAPEAA